MLARFQHLVRNERFRRLWSWSALGNIVIANLFLLGGFPLFADDCSRDWRRAED
jgi:hypothetical protein